MFFQLSHVPANGAPTRDLAQIIFTATSAIISAIPLEPATRIVGMDPAFAPPFRERLRRIDAKIIERGTPSSLRNLCSLEPARRKFCPAIGHVFSAEHAELEHLFRRQLGRKPGAEAASNWFRAEINIALLHFVVHLHPYRFHLVLRKISKETEEMEFCGIEDKRSDCSSDEIAR